MTDLLTAHAATQPDKPAVVDDRGVDGRRTLTYAELEVRSNQLAHVFVDHGVTAGSKVVWCGQNSVGIVEMVNAARKIGATAVPLNYRLSDEEAAYVTDHSDASAVYTDVAYAPMFARIRDRIPQVEHVLVFDGDAPTGMVTIDPLVAGALPTLPEDPPDDLATGATMIYTSGTTGKPKGAFRRRAASPEQLGAMLAFIGYRSDDVYLTTGPLYHSGPGGFMGIALAMGQTIVVQHKFDPEDWLRLVETYRCSSTFAAPTPIRMICNLPAEVLARYDRSSMRIMIANAAPWSFALKQQYVAT
ncbi:MAG: AMP-binding protein, partial [Acidimicrobiia bacterium]